MSSAVVGSVGEGVTAVVTGGGRVYERAISVEGQGAVGRAADQEGAERIPVEVGIIGEHAGSCQAKGSTYIGRVSVAGHHGWVIHRTDGESDHGRQAQITSTISRLVGESIDPVEVSSGTYPNEPSAFRVKLPCAGLLTDTATRAFPWASLSFPRRPVPQC